MPTDDERRRVAAKLREYASWDDEGSLVDCQEWGESVLNLLECGDTEGECYGALADLIEPAPKCDREALLRLADELETDGVDCYVVSKQYVLDEYASRIRKALGVVG